MLMHVRTSSSRYLEDNNPQAPSTNLHLLPRGYLDAEVKGVVAHALTVAQEVYDSCFGFYPTFRKTSNKAYKFSDNAKLGINNNMSTLQAMGNTYPGQQAVADRFSRDMGIQRFHA